MKNSPSKMSPKKPSSPRSSSLFTFIQEHIQDKSFKSDFHRSYIISRRSLTILRVALFIYSVLSFGFVLYHCENFNDLFTLPYWALALQTMYFGLVAYKSVRKVKEGDNQLLLILYELVFSFQLFNFLYYWIVIVHKENQFSSMGNVSWLSVSVLSFVAIWIEQVFNMARFQIQHMTVIFGAAAFNLVLSNAINFFLEGNVYNGKNASFNENLMVQLILLVSPVCHFVGGYKYYQHKRDEKGQKRKKLSEALVSNFAVKDRMLKTYTFY